MYDSMIDYWADYGADVRHDPEDWGPSVPTTQDDADALAAVLDAPEPDEPDWDFIDANCPF